MRKDLFALMRQQEIETTNFLPTKKEITNKANELSNEVIYSGEYNLQEIHAQALRNKEAFTILEKNLRDSLPQENSEYYGLKASFVNGGAKLNYTEDSVYNALKKDLDDRVKLLKLAQSQEVLDLGGIPVPKVSLTHIKSSLKITY